MYFLKFKIFQKEAILFSISLRSLTLFQLSVGYVRKFVVFFLLSPS